MNIKPIKNNKHVPRDITIIFLWTRSSGLYLNETKNIKANKENNKYVSKGQDRGKKCPDTLISKKFNHSLRLITSVDVAEKDWYSIGEEIVKNKNIENMTFLSIFL